MKILSSVGLSSRTLIQTLAGVVVYVAGLYLCIWFIENHATSNWAIPVAMIPIIAIALALSSAMRYVRGMDELHRKMHLEALAFAFSAQWFILIAYGFLRLAGITLFSADVLAPIMMLLWVIGLLISVWRYR